MYSYANLTALLQQHNQTTGASLSEAEQAKLLDYGRRASKVIEGRTNQWFIPQQRSEYLPVYPPEYIDPFNNALLLNWPLCEVSAVKIGTTTLDSDDYRLFPYGSTPAYGVQRLRSSGGWGGGDDDLYTITGVWLHRSRYESEAWINSGDTVQDDPLNATTTTINVSAVDGADAQNVTPRFTAGQVIRIEDEYCIVTDTTYVDNEDPTPDTNTLTVIRGALGSTGAAHDQDTQIDTFQPEPEIVRACMLMAAFNYANVGQYKRVEFNRTTGANETRMEIPDEAVEILTRYHWDAMGVV